MNKVWSDEEWLYWQSQDRKDNPMTQAVTSPAITHAGATETELSYMSHDGKTHIRALLWERDAGIDTTATRLRP